MINLNFVAALSANARNQFANLRAARMTIIICTYNRAKSLELALTALRRQTYPKFEVVVVNGPSTDDTDVVLQRQAHRIKVALCPEPNLARSRNIGIDNAAGEIIAFLDDDAIPTSVWLERLAGAYRDPAVMAAGGAIAHENGVNWGIMTCSRCGEVTHSSQPPASHHLGRGVDPFLYISGSNMSFRRGALIDVGGFNEYLTYGYDDVEICRQFVDAGHVIAFLEDAYVHHCPQANAVRDTNGVTMDPYAPMRARAVFALQDESNKPRLEEVIARLRQASDFRNYVEDCFRQNFLCADQRESFLRRLEQGVTDGIQLGLKQRPVRRFALRSTNPFRRFPIEKPLP